MRFHRHVGGSIHYNVYHERWFLVIFEFKNEDVLSHFFNEIYMISMCISKSSYLDTIRWFLMFQIRTAVFAEWLVILTFIEFQPQSNFCSIDLILVISVISV